MRQGSEEWRRARIGKVTGSRFADVMRRGRGESSSKAAEAYMYELIAEIVSGEPQDDIRSRAISWGNEHEPSARAMYSWLHEGVNLQQVGFIDHPYISRCGCSADSLVEDDGILEIKCPYNTVNHLKVMLSKKVPDEYFWQCQGNMMVTGRSWCDFVSYDPRLPDKQSIVIVRELRHEDSIEELERRVEQFVEQLELKLARVMK